MVLLDSELDDFGTKNESPISRKIYNNWYINCFIYTGYNLQV